MTASEKKFERRIIGKLKTGGSMYVNLPGTNTVIRVSSHFPDSDRLNSESPTKDSDNVFWILVKDFINPQHSELDARLLEAVNMIDLGEPENGKAIIEERISFIGKDSGKNIACSITGAKEGEIMAEIESVRRMIRTHGFPNKS